MSKNRSAAIGTSSVLVIFATLALVALALMSMYTATAGKNLSDNAFSSAVGYYAAEEEANRILASIREGNIPEGVDGESGLISYTVAIDDRQRLTVELSAENGGYSVLRWQVESRFEWVADDTIHVFEPQN